MAVNDRGYIEEDVKMRQIGDNIYIIDEERLFVRKLRILEINGDVYRCQNRRTDSILEISEYDTTIYDTKEEARKVVQKKENKKNFVYLLVILFIMLSVIGLIFLGVLSDIIL